MIHRFHVTNFKSILDVDLLLSPVTVLVGKSGTGKSNFVQAIRFLRDLLSSHQQPQNLQPIWISSRPAAKPRSVSRFEVEFSIADMQERFRYEVSLAPDGPQYPPLGLE